MEKNILALGTLLLFLSSQAFGWGPDTCKKAKCEVDGGKGFCNFDLGKSGFCEPCADIQNCEWLGLPPKGAKACKKLVKEVSINCTINFSLVANKMMPKVLVCCVFKL